MSHVDVDVLLNILRLYYPGNWLYF